jgi:release factor glutamine methyltransferase
MADVASMTIATLVEELATMLGGSDVADPILEARELVAALHDAPHFWPVANASRPAGPAVITRARDAARRRAAGAPFAYAVGRAAFRSLFLDVDERVLIPRPETEQLVELVLGHPSSRSGGVAIDVGTGSGAIAIALATEAGLSRVIGIDVSLDALDVARANGAAYARTARAPIEFVHGSLLAPVAGVQADVVVSNPPYIASREASELPASVRDWEPSVALYSGAEGMAATARLVREAVDVLGSGGLLAMEVDSRRASLAAELVARERCFGDVRIELDLTGRERFVIATKR